VNTTHRPYSQALGDLDRLCRLLVDYPDPMRRRSTWSLGRLVDWQYGFWGRKPDIPDFWGQNAELWFDGFGELATFCISEGGGADFELVYAPGHRFLLEEMVDWAIASWGKRGDLEVEITEHQIHEAAMLTGRGFRLDRTFCTQIFDLSQPIAPVPALEPGFEIVSMSGYGDYVNQARLRANAFQKIMELSEEQLAERMRSTLYSHTGQTYHAPADLCVAAPDGRFVAGCEGLIDGRNCQAEIERVVSHSEFRRRGFARAVIIACLHKLREMGLERAYVSGYSEAAIGLYSSLGARWQNTNRIYKRTTS